MDSIPYTDEKLIAAPKNLDELIAELHKVFDEERVNVEYVKALLTSYRSNPKDWRKYAKYDPHRYTRNLVDEGNGKFNLMALCWGEGQGSSIHDHTNSHCFVKVLDGQLMETMFSWPSDSEDETAMQKLSSETYNKDQCAYICDEMGLHRMENPSHTDSTVTLHLYVPPFSSCRCFDEKTGHCNEVKVTFWSKFGERTPFTTDNRCAVPPPENN